MDSITQAALGAVLGDLTLSRRIGRLGLLWGAFYGTLPDLDILAYPWLDQVEQLRWHRGLSHSVLFVLLATPLLAWLIARVHRGPPGRSPPPTEHEPPGRRPVSYRRALLCTFLVLTTHVGIDLFNAYGTQLLEPFSDRRFGLRNMFILDPLFTLPMLLPLLAAPWLGHTRRRRWLAIGLCLSTAYAGFTLIAKQKVGTQFTAALARQGLVADRVITMPTPLNTLYWRCLALDVKQDVVWSAYLSLFDPVPDVHLHFTAIPRRTGDLGDLAHGRAAGAVQWFTEGFYAVRVTGQRLTVADLRLGDSSLGQWPPEEQEPSVFLFDLGPSPDEVAMRRGSLGDVGATLRFLFARAFGLMARPDLDQQKPG